ncbi:MAG: hypothetical protein U5K69_18765 [Balneolaceae bacterium]|nr:hypothetical protein [Balneolaceae bacterium]
MPPEPCLEFLVLGKLHDSGAFPVDDIDREMVIKYAHIKDDYAASCYRELIEHLKKLDRKDLADAVQVV